uniref:Uncharacterized protein n=1 Tax=Megaselia scalaris TaxID=36166 RepID=T1GYM8_MEGSC
MINFVRNSGQIPQIYSNNLHQFPRMTFDVSGKKFQQI